MVRWSCRFGLVELSEARKLRRSLFSNLSGLEVSAFGWSGALIQMPIANLNVEDKFMNIRRNLLVVS